MLLFGHERLGRPGDVLADEQADEQTRSEDTDRHRPDRQRERQQGEAERREPLQHEPDFFLLRHASSRLACKYARVASSPRAKYSTVSPSLTNCSGRSANAARRFRATSNSSLPTWVTTPCRRRCLGQKIEGWARPFRTIFVIAPAPRSAVLHGRAPRTRSRRTSCRLRPAPRKTGTARSSCRRG